jgi:hypothetical protein
MTTAACQWPIWVLLAITAVVFVLNLAGGLA